VKKADLPKLVEEKDFDVLVVLGAGDVEDYMGCFAELIKKKN